MCSPFMVNLVLDPSFELGALAAGRGQGGNQYGNTQGLEESQIGDGDLAAPPGTIFHILKRAIHAWMLR